MKVITVMLNRGDGEGDRLVSIVDSVATAEAFIKVQDYPSWYDWYSWDVTTLTDLENTGE
jgi:hypothetical protein